MHERRVLDDMDIDGRNWVKNFTLTMNIIDTTYNAMLSERYCKDGTIDPERNLPTGLSET